jgi:hypothetical protein
MSVDRKRKLKRLILACNHKIATKWSYNGVSAAIDIRRPKIVIIKTKMCYNRFKPVDKKAVS